MWRANRTKCIGATNSFQIRALIGVLLARTAGVSDIEARAMLDQINELVEESDLDHLGDFVSVHNNQVYPAVEVVSCSSTNPVTLVDCARNSLSAMRNSVSADIVLLMVYQDIAGDCGGVDPDMINRPTISQANQDLAYVVVEKGCFNQAYNSQVVASHEVGHVLSIEHEEGDPAIDLPAGGGPTNHAYDNIYDNATEVASAGDCLFNCDFHNFFSDKDKDFLSLPLDDAGNSSHSNAVDVVESLSWNVVAAYRTPPPPPACHIVLNQWCDGDSPLASVVISHFFIWRARKDGLAKLGASLPCGQLGSNQSPSGRHRFEDLRQGKQKRHPRGVPFLVWRARKDSNLRPPGS